MNVKIKIRKKSEGVFAEIITVIKPLLSIIKGDYICSDWEIISFNLSTNFFDCLKTEIFGDDTIKDNHSDEIFQIKMVNGSWSAVQIVDDEMEYSEYLYCFADENILKHYLALQ